VHGIVARNEAKRLSARFYTSGRTYYAENGRGERYSLSHEWDRLLY